MILHVELLKLLEEKTCQKDTWFLVFHSCSDVNRLNFLFCLFFSYGLNLQFLFSGSNNCCSVHQLTKFIAWHSWFSTYTYLSHGKPCLNPARVWSLYVTEGLLLKWHGKILL